MIPFAHGYRLKVMPDDVEALKAALAAALAKADAAEVELPPPAPGHPTTRP